MIMTGRNRVLLAGIILLSLLACRFSTGDGSQSAVWREEKLQVGDDLRWFRVYEPRDLQNPAPVVVLLHGGTQSMRKIFEGNSGGTQAWLDVADQEGILLLVPNGTNRETGDTKGDHQNWNDLRPASSADEVELDDVAFVNALLNWAEQSYALDASRIYVTGASNGGMMTYRLLIELPERFATGAAFISSLPDDLSRVSQPDAPTPLMIVNGTEDPLVKWQGGNVGGRGNGKTLPVEDSLAWWLAANRAIPGEAVSTILPDLDPDDKCRLHVTQYPALDGGAPVRFIKMDGGGHALPSMNYGIPDNVIVDLLIGPVCQDAEGAWLAWEFMQEFTR
jgi:polyhydroxybutyrate depolymerase